MVNWNDATEVEVPRGAYISWGSKTGQAIAGKVMDVTLDGGSDFNGDPCPSLAIELVEPAFSVNKDGDRSDFDSGELVQLNCGQVSLKRAIRAADLHVGDLVKIELENLVKTERGTVKEYGLKVLRGKGSATNGKAKAKGADEEIPF